MSFYSIEEKEKWLPYVEKKMIGKELSDKAAHLLTNLDITNLDYAEFEREEVEGGEIITWYIDFNYKGKSYEYRRSENLETGKHLCYGYFLKGEVEFFDELLKQTFQFDGDDLYDTLEIFDEFFYELD